MNIPFFLMTNLSISDLPFIRPMAIDESRKFEIGASLARSSTKLLRGRRALTTTSTQLGKGGARWRHVGSASGTHQSPDDCDRVNVVMHEPWIEAAFVRVARPFVFFTFFFNLFPVSVPVARGTPLGTPRRKWGSGRGSLADLNNI